MGSRVPGPERIGYQGSHYPNHKSNLRAEYISGNDNHECGWLNARYNRKSGPGRWLPEWPGVAITAISLELIPSFQNAGIKLISPGRE